MNSKDRDYDDLTAISGIKEKRQQLLRQLLNVRTYQDLANLSVDEIEAAFRAEEQIVSRDSIEQWITEAQKFSTASELSSQRAVESAEMEADEEAIALTGEKEWEWLRAFVVEFCVLKQADQVKKQEIRTYPLKVSQKGDWLENGEAKETPVVFQQGEQIYPWMVKQLDQEAWPAAVEEPLIETPPVEAPPAEAPPARVTVTQIRAFQPVDAETPAGIGEVSHLFVGLIKSDTPFALDVAFGLSELAMADSVRRETTYKANFYVRNMATGISISLGDTKPEAIKAGQVSYTALLPYVTLQSGAYHVGVLVSLQSRPPAAGYLEVPLFQTV